MKRSILGAAIAALVLGFALQGSALASAMYWAEAGKIRSANLDGSGVQDVLSGFPDGVALDISGGWIYWADNPPVAAPGPQSRIRRACLDGSGQEILESSLWYPLGIALEPAHGNLVIGRMYWTDGSTNEIWRASLDGSQAKSIVSGLSSPFGIALDVTGGKMYWTRDVADPKVAAIERANLDGSVLEGLVKGLNGPTTAIALDLPAGKMYWGYVNPDIDGLYAGMIERASLDGSHVETVISGLFCPCGIALDAGGGKIYWTDSAPGGTGGEIRRANLDGSGSEILVKDAMVPRGIALDLTPAPEPATVLLLALGGLGALLRRKRR
jgi:DNA-binding beta-propeller fold protein YncE